ncbi:MAG: CBS and ACT domain-containing protein [Deltaproteobacteria bacterium]|jgi:acetoin utilization protein AcuB|nr:CBS and ACT domain-containing protein [Deltaproteobacteria bacterium]
MLVRKKMQKDLVTIAKNERMTIAKKILQEKNIRHLPVVDGKKLVGLVTNMDIRKAEASPATSLEIRELHYLLDKLTVEEIMTRNVITIGPDISVEEATTLLHDNKIGCLPVVEDGNLVGILTENDVMEILIEVMGMKEKGSRIEVLAEDKPGALADITRIIKEHNVNIISVVTDASNEPDKRLVVFKLKTFYFEPIKKALEAAGFPVQYAKIEK